MGTSSHADGEPDHIKRTYSQTQTIEWIDNEEISLKTKQPLDPNLMLYTTLEPCPMCLSRILTSGIPNVRYSAPNPSGGMVYLMDNLPPVWKEIAKGDTFTVANCSPDLQKISDNLFQISKEELDGCLINNTQSVGGELA
jgi:tRNA(adenine34) deaminase